MKVKIYTDGSCRGNQFFEKKRVGGCAFVVVENNKEIFRSNTGLIDTTNNRAELMAVMQATVYVLFHKKEVESATIYSDSKYVVNALNLWRYGWEKNGWKTSNGKDVKNKILFEEIIKNINESDTPIRFIHIKGHAGNKWNEIADKLAKGE